MHVTTETQVIVPKVWGYEKHIVNNDKYCGKVLVLNEGYRCSYHYHISKHETFYVSKGRVFMMINGRSLILDKGDTVIIAPYTKHYFHGLRDSEIIEFSTHDEPEDSYRLDQSCKVEDE